MKSFIKSLLQDERGRQSSKRIIALFGALFLCITLLLSLFVKTVNPPSPEIVSAIEFIVIACIGSTSIDKFSKKREDSTNTPS